MHENLLRLHRNELERELLDRTEYVGECLIFDGKQSKSGHVQATRFSQHIHWHVIAYLIWVGPVPKGYDVHHTCNIGSCMNPNHLIAKTKSDHARDHQIDKTHCKRGHPLSGDNLYIFPATGFRRCRQCINDARKAKRRGMTLDEYYSNW